jgi:hypothetical protein
MSCSHEIDIFLNHLLEFAQSATLDIEPGHSFHRVREHFIEVFADHANIDERYAVLVASCAYSWMPTIPTLHLEHVAEAVAVLKAVAAGDDPAEDRLEELRSFTNNSVIGMSKVLHLVAPNRYPIIDGRVETFLRHYGVKPKLDSIPWYLAYVKACRDACASEPGQKIWEAVNGKLQTANESLGVVSPIRALELVMYYAGKMVAEAMKEKGNR